MSFWENNRWYSQILLPNNISKTVIQNIYVFINNFLQESLHFLKPDPWDEVTVINVLIMSRLKVFTTKRKKIYGIKIVYLLQPFFLFTLVLWDLDKTLENFV